MQTLNQLFESKVQNSFMISTGYEPFDTMLEGGFRSGELVELYGSLSTGKSQLCMLMSIRAVLHGCDYHLESFHESQGVHVIYFDITASFSPKRIGQMLSNQYSTESFEKNHHEILKSIVYIATSQAFEFLNCLYQIRNDLSLRGNAVKLIVVDGFGLLLSQVLGKHSMGHHLLVEISRLLKFIAQEYHIIVIVTNYAIHSKNEKNGIRPGLGKTWLAMPDVQLYLEKSKDHDEKSQMTLKKTRNGIKDKKASYRITTIGFDAV